MRVKAEIFYAIQLNQEEAETLTRILSTWATNDLADEKESQFAKRLNEGLIEMKQV